MKKILYFIFIICGFISCTKEVEITVPEEKNKLVLYSTIVPFSMPMPKYLTIDVMASSHIYDTTKYYIPDANILLFKNNKLIDTIEYVDSKKTYPLNIFPEEGEQYTIKVNKNGYDEVIASTSIPSKVKIDEVNITPVAVFDEDGLVYSEASITFQDPENEINFYEIAISGIAYSSYAPDVFDEIFSYDKIIKRESYYPSDLNFNLKDPKSLLFNDENINGKSYTVNVYYFPNQDIIKSKVSEHLISVHLRNVSEEYYRFKTSMLRHLYNQEEDILYGAGEPQNILSNVEGGYGIFAGFNDDIVSLEVKETKY